MSEENNPFADWSELVHKAVYSIDGKKIGFLQKILSDYMLVGRGLVILTKFFVPKSLVESVSNKGIRLRITAYEVNSRYSYAKMREFLPNYVTLPRQSVEHRIFYDRFQTLRYSITRNRLAAGIASLSGVLFLFSGYKATLTIYNLIQQETVANMAREYWMAILVPVGILAFLSQLGGFTVLTGAGLFAANRVNLGKFFVSIGAGQGLFTVSLHLVLELLSGRIGIQYNYITWLTASAAGLGVLFAVVSQSVSKGKDESIAVKAFKFILKRQKNRPENIKKKLGSEEKTPSKEVNGDERPVEE